MVFSSVPTYICGTEIETVRGYWGHWENSDFTIMNRSEYLGLPGLRNKGSSGHSDIEKLAAELLQPEQKHCNHTMVNCWFTVVWKKNMKGYLCISKLQDRSGIVCQLTQNLKPSKFHLLCTAHPKEMPSCTWHIKFSCQVTQQSMIPL